MKLYPLSISQLHFLESGQFITRFFSDFTALGIDASTDPRFKTLYEDLQAQLPTYTAAQMQVKAQQETEALQQLDDIRDKKVRALRFAVKAYRDTDEATKKSSYQLLSLLLNTYKGIEKENFEAESAGLDKLVMDLKNATYSPAVAALNVGEHVSNIELANTNFKQLFTTRSNNTTTEVAYNTKLLRKNLLDTYRKMANYIASVVTIDNSDFYTKVLSALNNGRAYFAGIVARRNAGESPTTPTA